MTKLIKWIILIKIYVNFSPQSTQTFVMKYLQIQTEHKDSQKYDARRSWKKSCGIQPIAIGFSKNWIVRNQKSERAKIKNKAESTFIVLLLLHYK